MESIYETLRALPLLGGVSYEKLQQVVGTTKFHFLKYPDGDTLVEAGQPCDHIKFLISGSVRVSIVNSNGRFKVSQTIDHPDVIAPDFLFGRATVYPCTVQAIGSVGIVQISKADYVKLLNSDEVFLFNYLNYISVRAQKSVEGVLALTTGSLEERIAFWIAALTQRQGKDIVLSCRQRDLYALFGVQRSSFIATMESMKQQGLIDYNQHEIRIVSRSELMKLLSSDD